MSTPEVPLVTDLDDVPLPDIGLMDLPRYFANKSFPLSPDVQSAQRRANVLTSRGCPYHCDFCFNALGRNRVRYRSPDSVLAEIAELVARHSIDYVSFLDESFLVNKPHVHAICDGLEEKSLKWGVAARSTSVTPEILTRIKQAGCDFIYFGFDSGSTRTLERMNKRMTLDDNFEAFRMCVEAGIYPVPNIIIGYDNEDLSDIHDTYRFFHRLIAYGKTLRDEAQKQVFERGFNNFGAIYFATPYPGSELYNRNRHRLPPLDELLRKFSGRDAYELTVNVSNIPDDQLKEEQQQMER